MRAALLQDDAVRTYVLVADPGEDAFEMVTSFARREELTAAQFTGIGAFARATVGWFDRQERRYQSISVDQQCEVLSLLGDIALGEDGPQVHAHLVVGLSDGTTRGGHLLRGEVWPTLEIIIREAPALLRKTSHPELGLALIDPSRTTG